MRPRVWIGVAIWLGYVATVFAVQRLSGVPYPDLGQSGSTLFRGAGLSLIVGTVLLAITTSLLGWWRPAMVEKERSVRWPVIAPALLLPAVLVNLVSTDWDAYDAAFLAASLVLLLVGFTEEIVTRGLLVVALRTRLGEVWVWLLSSLAFSLMHLVNLASGQALGPTLVQLLMTFLSGTLFYILRRTTGTLVWAMLLHAFWDFSVFAVGRGEAGPLAPLAGGINMLAAVVGLVVVAFVVRARPSRS